MASPPPPPSLLISLHKAVRAGDAAAVRELLREDGAAGGRHGLDLDAADPQTTLSPLNMAAQAGSVAVVEALLRGGASPRAANEPGGELPLHFAASFGHVDVCRVLLQADVGSGTADAATQQGHPPLFFACGRGHLPCVAELVERGGARIDVRAAGTSALLVTAGTRGIKADADARCAGILRYLLSKPGGSALLEERGEPSGATALIEAARLGRRRCVEALLEAGADAFARGRDGRTAHDVATTSDTREVLAHAMTEQDAATARRAEELLRLEAQAEERKGNRRKKKKKQRKKKTEEGMGVGVVADEEMVDDEAVGDAGADEAAAEEAVADELPAAKEDDKAKGTEAVVGTDGGAGAAAAPTEEETESQGASPMAAASGLAAPASSSSSTAADLSPSLFSNPSAPHAFVTELLGPGFFTAHRAGEVEEADALRAELWRLLPAAQDLDIRLGHVVGVGLDELSASQLDVRCFSSRRHRVLSCCG